MTGQLLSIPILGSFHTDLLDLLTTHNADPFQKFCVWLKERIDSDILDSCATTSTSFRVIKLTVKVAALSIDLLAFLFRTSFLGVACSFSILLLPLLTRRLSLHPSATSTYPLHGFEVLILTKFYNVCRSLRNELTFGDPNAFLCCYVGRISKEKRMDVLIDAIKQLPGTYLAIIGY